MKVGENSKAGTVVGTIKTKDPDNLLSNRQKFTYTLLDGDQKRFKIDNDVVEVNANIYSDDWCSTFIEFLCLWLLYII